MRRWAARALLVLPALLVLAIDLAERRARLLSFDVAELGFYLASAALGRNEVPTSTARALMYAPYRRYV